MNVLTRTLKTVWEEANKPILDISHDEFEQHVKFVLFPSETYDQLQRAYDLPDDHEELLQSLQLPDMKFRARTLGLDFFLETQFRSRFQDQIPEWCKFFQLKRYQELDNITPVLICIGLGGRPAMPERVFLIPVKHIKFVKLYPGFLQKYEIRPDRPVSEHALKRILE
jgi:hypothetical protein